MLKKGFFIGWIFAANILLLAHTLVPHHHHEGIPHFSLPDFHHSQETDNECEGCCCRHEENETCLFEQNINLIYENKNDYCCIFCLSNHHPEVVPGFLTYDFSTVRAGTPLLEPPCLISYLFDYANSGQGLRAPPELK